MPSLAELTAFLREWGVPLAMLAIFAFAILVKRKRRRRDGTEAEGAPFLAPGWQIDKLIDDSAAAELELRDDCEKRIAFLQQLWHEERAGRLAADERLAKALETMREQGAAISAMHLDVARLAGIRSSGSDRDA